MSKTVDERVVEMRFDNRDFERNVSTTMSTLDKLKQKLHLAGAARGLETVGSAAKKVDMSGLATGVETVSARFSAMQVIGVTALANITNSAVNAGKRMVEALTIDPVKSGFQEYETQMNAVQTILANTQSKGSTLKDVNAALDELNTYADKTIYNFTEMTRNIGTFTAAGIDLETSVSAIQGIANLAAVSGSTSQQASTAMYQLSQALASGTVKLMDWNSVVNAGMGGEIFQNALRETSKLLGTGAEAAIKAKGSFRESLTTGWLTAEVLTETLKKFTTSGANEYVAEYTGLSVDAVKAALESAKAQYGEAEAIDQAAKALAKKSGKSEAEIKNALQMAQTAENAATKVKTFTQLWDVMKEAAQSGWAQTWRLIIGDFEQAKSLLTPLADFFTEVIGKMSDARNNLLESALGKGFSDLAKKFDNILAPAKEAANVVDKVSGSMKDLDEVVNQVIRGEWGRSDTGRFERLAEAGYNYCEVQNKVNETLGNSFRYTQEQIDAQNELLGVQKKTTESTSESAEETSNLTDEKKKLIKELASMSEEQLRAKGYTEEQISAFKELRDTAEKLGIPLNDFIDNLDEINGRWLLINSFKNVGQGLITVIKAIGWAWRDIFPAMQSEQLFNIIAGLHKFTTYLRVSDDAAENLRRTLRGVFAALDIVLTVVGGPIKIAFKALTQLLSYFHLDILDVTAGIGDAIVEFRDWIDSTLDFTKVFKKVIPVVKKFATGIKKWFEGFKNSEFYKIGENLIQGLVDGIKEKGAKVWEAAIELGKKLLEKLKEILGIHSPSTETFEIGENLVQGLVNGIASGLKWIFESIRKIGSTIVNTFKEFDFGPMTEPITEALTNFKKLISGFDWKTLLAIIPIGVVLVVAKQIYDISKTLADGIDSLNGVIEGFANVENAFADVLKSFSKNIKAEAMKKIATSILMLAAAVLVLSFIPLAKLWNAVGAIAVISVILVGLSFAIDKLNSASVKLGKGGLELSGLRSAILSLGVTLLLLTVVIEILGNMKQEEATAGFIRLGILAGGIVTALLAISLIALIPSKNLDRVCGVMIKLSIAMVAMLIVCNLVKTFNADDLKPALDFIGAFLGLLALVNIIGVVTSKNVNKLGGLMIKLSIAMALMIGVCKFAATLKPEELDAAKKFGTEFLKFLGILTLITSVGSFISGGKSSKIGGTLLGVSAAMLFMMGVCKLAAKITPEEMDAATEFIVRFLAFLGLVVLITNFSKSTGKLAGTLLAMSIAIGTMAGIAILLGMVPTEMLVKGVSAVSALGVVMAAMIWATRGASECMKSIIAMAAAVAIMTGALVLLARIPWQELLPATLSLSATMLAFAGAMRIIGGMDEPSAKALIAIGVMTLVVGALGAVLYLLQGLDPIQGIAVVGVISLFLAALSIAVYTMQGLQTPSGMAIGALVVVTLVVAALGAVLYALQGVDPSQALGIVGAISLFLAAMLAVCYAAIHLGAVAELAIPGLLILVGFIGALGLVVIGLAALAMDVIAGMPKLGKNLSDFMTNVQPFIDGIQNIPDNISDQIGKLCGAILKLTETEILNAIANFLSGGSSLADLGNELKTFGQGMAEFTSSIGNIDAAVNSIGKIADIQEKIEGVDLSDLSTLGGQLKDYSNKVSEINVEAVSASINMATRLRNLVNSFVGIDPSGVSNFNISPIGSAIKNYYNSIANIDPTLINMSISTAIRLRNFISSLAGINTSGIGPFKDAITQLGTISISQIVAAFSASTEKLTGAGARMMTAVSSGIRSSMNVVIQAIGTVFNQTFVKMVGFAPRFQTAGIQLMSGFMLGINSRRFMVAASLILTLSSAVTTVNGYYDDFYNAGSYVVDGFAAGISANSFKAEAEAAAMAEATLEAAKEAIGSNSPAKKFIELGKYADQGMANGLRDYAYLAKNASTNLGYGIVTSLKDCLKINSPSKVTRDEVGQYIVDGIAEGITSNMSAEDAAAKKAKNIVNAFQTELDKLSLDATTLDLEYQLWSVNYGPTATDSEYAAKEAEKLNRELALQTERVQLADSEYQITMREFGETAEETQKAYNKLLEEKIKTSKLAAQIDEVTAKEFESSKSALVSYNKWMSENADNLRKFGFSEDRIIAAAKKETGYTGPTSSDFKKIDMTYDEVSKYCQDISKDSWEKVGKSSADGLKKGISGSTSSVAKAATNLAKGLVSTAKSTLGIKSPSKEFYSIGAYTIAGFANALRDGKTDIVKSATDGFGAAIAKVKSTIEGGMDARPTIRPVFDLSNIQNEASQINDLFTTRTMAVAMANSDRSYSRINALNDAIDRLQMANNNSNSEIVSAISELRSDFGSLINAIGGMQIRMDSGTVVGELINKIDSGLGQIATHKGRG